MKRDPKSPLRERLEAEAKMLAEKAKLAANVTDWIGSPGLQPPS
jgi:hypothetical protein